MRPVLLSLLFCTSVFAAEIRLGPERPITPAEIGLAPVFTESPVIASDGTDFLAVWRDFRSNSPNLVAARVTADGRVLDPTGIAVTSVNQASLQNVQWNGSEYVVTVGEFVPFGPDLMHYFAISREGVVRKSEAPPEPAVSWPVNERGETVMFAGYGKGQHTLWFLDPNGLMAKGVDLPEHYGPATHVIPMANREFAVVFGHGQLAHWALFSRTQGLVKDRALFSPAAGTDWANTTIAVSGRRLAAGWIGYNYVKQPDDSILTRYSSGWITIDEAGNYRAGSFDDATLVPPLRIVGDGATFHFIASFATASDIVLRSYRIVDGTVQGPSIVDRIADGEAAIAQLPSVATNGSRNLLIWLDGCAPAPGQCRFDVTTFARGGTPLDNDPVTLSRSAKMQREPALASGSDGGLLAVWRNHNDPPIRARLTTPGAPARMFEIAPSGTAPRAAFAGGTYGVIWYEPEDEQLLLRRFDSAGNPIDAAPVVLSRKEDARSYHIVPRGETLQVAWLGAPGATIRTVAVPPSGKVPASLLVSGGTVDPKRQHMVLTSNGNAATVVWTESTKIRNEPTIMWRSVRITGANTLGPVVEMTRTSEDPDKLGDTFAAALSDHALLVLLPISRKEGGCFATHTFAPDGASTIKFRELMSCADIGGLPRASLMWDGSQWWAVVQAEAERWWGFENGGGVQYVQQISRDSVAGAKWEVAPAATRPIVISVTKVPSGVAVLYTRLDATYANTRRAFIRVIGEAEAPGKGRAVRH